MSFNLLIQYYYSALLLGRANIQKNSSMDSWQKNLLGGLNFVLIQFVVISHTTIVSIK